MRHYVRCVVTLVPMSVTTHSTTQAHPPSHVHAPSKSFLHSLSQATGFYWVLQTSTHANTLSLHTSAALGQRHQRSNAHHRHGTRMQACETTKRPLMISFLRILAKYVVVFCRVVFSPPLPFHPLPFLFSFSSCMLTLYTHDSLIVYCS